MQLGRKVVWGGYNELPDNLLTASIKRLTGRKFTPTTYPSESEFYETWYNNFPNKWTFEDTRPVIEGCKVKVWSFEIVNQIMAELEHDDEVPRGPDRRGFQFKVYSAATWCEDPAGSPTEITTRYHVLTDPWHPQYLVATYKDAGKIKPAKTGYHFPLFGRQVYGTGQEEIIVDSDASPGSFVTTHVQVRWRCAR